MDLLKNLIWTDESKEVGTCAQVFGNPPELQGPAFCGGGGGGTTDPDPKPPVYAAGITCLAGPSIC